MTKLFMILLTLIMVLATDSKYCLIETKGVYGIFVKDKTKAQSDEGDIKT